MIYILRSILKKIRKRYKQRHPVAIISNFHDCKKDYSFQDASDIISDLINSPKPAMIARFGKVELNCVVNYLNINSSEPIKDKISKYIKSEIDHLSWDKQIISEMKINAGFFSNSIKNIEQFCIMMIQDMAQVDILGSWLEKEEYVKNKMLQSKTVRLLDLEPYYHDIPWSKFLAGKKVLVIHPFTESIINQYNNKRELLFKDKSILPKFDLITIKAVQTIAGNNDNNFENWFDALNFMKNQIIDIDFDIAIIGCGAYGFPLAAHIKRMNKKSIHLGGATQILFGIIGQRWETEYKNFNFPNEHWVRPSPNEVPKQSQLVENACYW